MTEINDKITSIGEIEMLIEYENGLEEKRVFKNDLLNSGRAAIASCLANNVDNGFNLYINRMIFGDGGTVDGNLKTVIASRNGLFGTTQVSKPVISTINPSLSSQVILTSVISRSEGNGSVLNEMALQLANGDLYSMATFPDLTKTSQMQITWSWRITIL